MLWKTITNVVFISTRPFEAFGFKRVTVILLRKIFKKGAIFACDFPYRPVYGKQRVMINKCLARN